MGNLIRFAKSSTYHLKGFFLSQDRGGLRAEEIVIPQRTDPKDLLLEMSSSHRVDKLVKIYAGV